MKSNSYIIDTALRSCIVRFEERAREFVLVARLIYEAEAKASVKARQSLGQDLKPDDLFLDRVKFCESEMEARTGAMCMCSDDLGIGVKSHSNSAIAGSC